MPGAQNQPFGATPPKAFLPAIGLTVRIGPGPDAAWLGTDSVTGIVCDIVPGQLHEATTVVKLEQPVDGVGRTGRTVTGDYLVLEPAGSPSRWRRTGSAHVEVWAEPPSSEPWLEREAGVWVDDAALRIRLIQLHVTPRAGADVSVGTDAPQQMSNHATVHDQQVMTVGQPVDEAVDPQTEGGDGFATRCHEAVEIEQPLLGRRIEVGPLSALDLTEVELTQFGRGRRLGAHQPGGLHTASQIRTPDRLVGAGGDARQRGGLTPTDVVEADIGASGVAALRRPVRLPVADEPENHPTATRARRRDEAADSTAISPTCSIAPSTSPVVPP